MRALTRQRKHETSWGEVPAKTTVPLTGAFMSMHIISLRSGSEFAASRSRYAGHTHASTDE